MHGPLNVKFGRIILTVTRSGWVKMKQIKSGSYFPEMYKCNRIEYGKFSTTALPIPPLNK